MRRDEETLIESDDLLQADTIYGGLIEDDGSTFGFACFPEHAEKGVRYKWEFELDAFGKKWPVRLPRRSSLEAGSPFGFGCVPAPKATRRA